ncbi:MAG: sulfotransferase family 2 domain-containing protein [Candidatus Promineifilaceae bacterium]
MISHQHRCIFIHIPKCAGRSVGISLQQQAKVLNWRGPEVEFTMRNEGLAKMLNLYPHYFTFTFVRNPFDRLVSIWRHSESRIGSEVAGDYNYYLRPQSGLSLKAYAKLIHTGDHSQLSRFDRYHAQPQVSFILDYNRWRYFGVWRRRWGKMGFIGRYETLQHDFNTVCSRLSIPHSTLPHYNKAQNRQHYSHYYDAETIQIVREIYADDIKRLDYQFEQVDVHSAVSAQ